jgi:hypothetical protein
MGAPDVEGLPWPEGEPGALNAAAGQLTGVAGQLSAAGGPLGRAAGLGGWSGGASLASSLLLATQMQSVHGAAEVFGSTGSALRGLARLLSDGQDRIRALAREVKAAREAAEHAQGLADTAGRRMAAQPDSVGLESAFLHLSAAAGQAQGEHARIRQRAETEARQIVEELEAADAATAGEVAEAEVAATAGPGGLPAGTSQVDIQPVALAWLHAPHLRFHPDEQHLPADLREALRRGQLVFRDGRWFLDLPDGDRDGGSTSAPVDFTVVERDGRRYLMYRVWYGYNDKTAFGDHEGDLELFGVELDENDRPVAALYYGHGKPHRVPWDEVEREDGHPVPYVASGSHASYPEPGHYPIAHGVGTDQAADGGRRAETEHQLRPGPDRYRLPGGADLPAGARLGEDGGSPLAPNTGANAEPFPAGSAPIEGKPDRGDGLDGTVVDIVEAGASPITIGQDAIGLLP